MSMGYCTNAEKERNMVLCMNLDDSREMIENERMSRVRFTADQCIADSKVLIHKYGKDVNHENCVSENEKRDNTRCRSIQMKPWEDVVGKASSRKTYRGSFDEFATERDWNKAFGELDEINREFSRVTSIVNKTDLTFLVIATALQIFKVQVFPSIAKKFDYGKPFDVSRRLDHNDKTIVNSHRHANNEFLNQQLQKHEAGDWIDILGRKVPYDITKGSPVLGLNMGGKMHRMYTLGHDPFLGWIFGTANIMTDCITFNNFMTNRISRYNPLTGKKDMRITSEIVPLFRMFEECGEMIQENYMYLPAAVFAQAQHLKSDVYTKMGLPVPMISSFAEAFSNQLYKEHYDALCLARDAKVAGGSFVVSKLIDLIIILTHEMFNEGENRKLFEARTRKILMVSDSIASTSSIVRTALTGKIKDFDIGGMLNTILNLFSDIRFLASIKREYVENEISKALQKENAKMDRLLSIS